MELFAIQNLSFAYPGQEPVLREISLTVEEGEMLLIIGDSGSGKTSLLKQLKPQLTPRGQRSGSIFYLGEYIENVEAVRTAQEIGYVFQNPEHQIVTDKVWHELAFGLENQRLSQEDMELRLGEVAGYFGIQGWFHQKTEELSGGQKQMVNLAAILAMNPRVIILDEPTSQLDPIASRNFLEMVRRVKEEMGITVIMVEHHINEVYPMADHVAVLSQGQLLHWGEARETAHFLSGRGLDYLLPAVPRIYGKVEQIVDMPAGGKKPPITLTEGRNWLAARMHEGVYCRHHQGNEGCGSRPGETVFKNTDVQMLCRGDLRHGFGRFAKREKQQREITLREVYYRYAGNHVDLLSHLSVDIVQGECFGILGGNGIGKTTLLRIMGGLLTPYSGKVRVRGKTAYLPQNPQSIFSHDCVADELSGTSDDLLSMFRLEHLRGRHPYDLSGGEQQRLSLLILLLTDPDILLLDEPTKGMDEECRRILGEILGKLKEQGKTIVLVSHDVEFAARYTNRCGLLFDGRLAGVKDTKSFFMQNQYYTTIARRMTRGIRENIVLEDEVMGNV